MTGFSNQLSNINQKFVNILDSLLSNTIDIAKYDNMSSYSPIEVVTSFNISKQLDQAIMDAIESEIKPHISLFVYDNYSYTLQNILNRINFTPSTDILSYNLSTLDVTLYYDGILESVPTQLTPKNASNSSSANTFTVIGFASVSQEVLNELNSLPNNINVAKYDDMDSYTAAEAFNVH
ncbi:hypothetical protein J6W34_08655 [bacterium]|nr:hypothetical protein [bacterium]